MKSDTVGSLDRARQKVLRICKQRVRHHRKIDTDFVSKTSEEISIKTAIFGGKTFGVSGAICQHSLAFRD